MEAFQEQLRQQFQLPLQNPVLVFALILLIILLAPILLKRFKIPGIIGLIIAGVIFGPHGLNLLAKSSAIDLFSTIGLLYIMFIAGIELEMSEFRKNRSKSVGFGAMTFLLPLLLGFPACYYLLGFDFTASLLTASMFSTHTMIAYPIVTKFGISKDRAVAVTVGGTIITDTAVLLLLAFITGSHQGVANTGFWIRLIVSMVLLLLVMFLVVPRVARWFFIRLEGEKTSHYVFILSIVFLSAFFSQIAGLEPIIGAFIAGLALNRLVPQSSVLMNRIQFIGNSLFIPFFLISVGMLVDLKVLFEGPVTLWVALVLTVVALIGKYVAARATQLVYRFSRPQGLLIFGLSSSHAAATMAVILVGFNAGIIDKSIFNGTIILILVTCLVASFATEKASKDLVLKQAEPDSPMSNPVPQRESILIPVANMSSFDALLEFGYLIKEKSSIEPIRILSVVSDDVHDQDRLVAVKARLDLAVSHSALTDIPIETVATAEQNIPAGINRVSREQESTTVITGWPTRESLSDKVFGPKTLQLIQIFDKNLFICRFRKPLNTHRRIILACPPYSELEPGFEYAIRKIFRLGVELDRPVELHARSRTLEAAGRVRSALDLPVQIREREFADWKHFDQLIKQLVPEDIAVILAARSRSVSYNPNMEQVMRRVSELGEEFTLILAYPMINPAGDKYDKYQDFTSEPLSRSMETFNRIQRGLGKMIQKAE